MSTKRVSENTSSKTSEQDSAPTTRRISSLAHEAVESASGRAEEVETRLRAEANRISEKSSEAAADAKKQLDNTLDRLDSFIREKPFTAAGIAFAAGVVGALLVRK